MVGIKELTADESIFSDAVRRARADAVRRARREQMRRESLDLMNDPYDRAESQSVLKAIGLLRPTPVD